MTVLYGIPNCDTVKKARKWLDEHNVDYRFHDFRKDGLNVQQVQAWQTRLGDALINKRSTSWKQLSDEQKQSIDSGKGIALIIDMPTLIKRPVLEYNQQINIGFKAENYHSIFNH